MDAEAFEGTITDLYLPKKAGPPQREGRFRGRESENKQ
jgi:hypothetical protein